MNPRENLAPPPEMAKPLDQQAELSKQTPETVLPTAENSLEIKGQLGSLQQSLQEVNGRIANAEQQLTGLKDSLDLSKLDQWGLHIRGFEKQQTGDIQTRVDFQRQIEQLREQQEA